MRTWGRIYHEDGTWTWTKVETDGSGSNDKVMLTTLIQCLLLNLGESPFYAKHGIPAYPAVHQQIVPDFDVMKTQAQFAPFFAAVIITKLNDPEPHYRVAVTTHQGVKLTETIPV